MWEDREVGVRFVSAEEAAALPLRKESGRTGTLRLIEVADFDLSACGGTHVARTGGIGLIAVTGWEKFKGGTRVEFLCGGRALARLREWRDALAATNRLLSVSPAELAPAIERLQAENKALARTRPRLPGAAGHATWPRSWSASGERVAGRIVVARAMDGWDAAGLKAIAAGVAAHPGTAVAVFSTTDAGAGRHRPRADVAVDAARRAEGAGRDGSAARAAASPTWRRAAGSSGDVDDIVARGQGVYLRRPSVP